MLGRGSSYGSARHLPVAPAKPKPIPRRDGTYTKLSVVVAVLDRWEMTRDCLDTLQQDVPEAEIIVVDNGSGAETRDGLRRRANIRIVRFEDNHGVPMAWNAGLQVATGDVQGVLNNDTRIHPGGMKTLAQDAWEVGIAGYLGASLGPEGQFLGYTSHPDHADYIDGTALLARRDVWAEVGMFDPELSPAYSEDADWGIRARLRGCRWTIRPEVLEHLHSQTSGSMPELKRVQAENRRKIRDRYAGYGLGERVLIRRWGAAGDVLMTTPALRAYRERWPLARLHLQCADRCAEAVQGCGVADECGPDLVPHWQYTTHYDLDGAYEAGRREGVWEHPVLAYARELGVPLSDYSYAAAPTPDLEAWAKGILPDGSGPWIALGLRSCFRPKTNWGEAHWRELVDALPEQQFLTLDPVRQPDLEPLWGDHPHALPVPEGHRRLYRASNVRDLTGKTPDLRHVLALLRRCRAAVSADTATLHLAAAVGLPVVGLFGGSPGSRLAPLTGKVRVIDGWAPCMPCLPGQCFRNGPHCLAHITGRDVAQVLDLMLRC